MGGVSGTSGEELRDWTHLVICKREQFFPQSIPVLNRPFVSQEGNNLTMTS